MNPGEPSFLSHQSEVRSSLLSECGLTTIIYCGKIRSGINLTDILQVHRKFVEDEVNDEEVSVTGLLMGQGNSVLHLLEGPSFSVLKILKHLAGHSHFVDVANPIQTGRIIYSVEDHPKRHFPEWYSITIQERKSQADEVTDENCKDIVTDLATRLLEIGKSLQFESQEDISRYADQLPGKSLILSLSSAGSFFTLEDFVKFHCDSYHVELESELTWPLERMVCFC